MEKAEKKEETSEDTCNRLIDEVRELHKQIDTIKKVLYTYKDLSYLSTKGAVELLVRNCQALDSIKYELKKAKRTKSDSECLALIETLLQDLDD